MDGQLTGGVLLLVVLAIVGYVYTTRSTTVAVPSTNASPKDDDGSGGAVKGTINAKKHHTKKSAHHDTYHAAGPAKPKLPEHELLAHVLKGHTGPVTSTCFSPNGRFIATASTDRTIRLTMRDTLGTKNPVFKTINIPYDHATTCSFSSDGKTLGVVTADGQAVHLYQKFKTKPECSHTFKITHEPLSLLLNDIGDEWMTLVTVGKDNDTDVKCWNVHGDLLQSTSINQIQNFHGVQSKDNRFIAVAAFTPEVKIYEIKRTKQGSFDKLHKAMALQGHKSGVMDVAFDGSDATPVNHLVTTSKDGSVRLWDINVRYKLEEDPKCIKTYTSDVVYSTVDMTANGAVIALGHGTELSFLNAETMQLVLIIANAQDDAITRIQFDATGREILVQGTTSRITKVYRTPTLV
ncbi:Aste57867_15007 [Aphanomyces stellatus]|uniref:Aste57867_15007 protein n=1 Tax=Aphanomyces stellatus TaxID=120398 RepID=A0A485L302_9STRA|nr:hypothetical protein As57867_014951 [Aphanomyces stellatus]VFT91821.1 Aste57867_15007 [Aphanomyces stellatus]